jgi:amicyanin
MNKRLLGAVLIVLVVAIVGIGAAMLMKDDTPATPAGTVDNTPTNTDNQQPKAEATNSVTISNYTFGPATITVKVGTKVTWTNQDSVGHTVTADSGSGPDSQLIDQGQSYSFTFDKAGTFTYHCTPHPYMKGTVIVTE